MKKNDPVCISNRTSAPSVEMWTNRTGLFAAILAYAALFSALLPTTIASAQATEDDLWADVEEIVVTGTAGVLIGQTEQSSVLGFDAEDLVEARITDVGSLAEHTPNLEIKTGASNVSSPTLFIRGIGLLDFNSNASSSVAIFNDDGGVSLQRAMSAGGYDLRRQLEELRSRYANLGGHL